jgi:hypothetical protein
MLLSELIAIVPAGSIPALREQDARLGGTCKDEDSFPLTDAGNSARRRMFRAVRHMPHKSIASHATH